MRYSLGIDLGTTFVGAALANGTTVEMFTLGDCSVVIPAVVYLRGDGTLATGEAATVVVVQVEKTPSFVAVPADGEHAYIAHGDAQLITVVDTAVN